MAFRSLVPYGLRPTNDWWDMWQFPPRIFDQHFGVPIGDEDLMSTPMTSVFPRPRVPFSRLMSTRGISGTTGTSEVSNEKDQFKVKLDVSHFSPDELTVKATDGNCLIIEGKHEEKVDEHGYVSRHFKRKYLLPKDCEAEKIASSLTPEGILVVTAPKRVQPALQANERAIPIAVTNTPIIEPMQADSPAGP